MTKELFAEIEGYEGLYMVSNTGRVISLQSAHELKPFYTSNGYKSVSLWKDGKPTKAMIHRLVAIAFIEQVDGKPHVNHRDGNKENNDVSNLEWCNRSENMKHAWRNGLVTGYSEKRDENIKRMAKGHMKPVIRDDGEIYESIGDAAKALGAKRQYISAVLNGKRRAYKGYTFSFVEESDLIDRTVRVLGGDADA